MEDPARRSPNPLAVASWDPKHQHIQRVDVKSVMVIVSPSPLLTVTIDILRMFLQPTVELGAHITLPLSR